MGLAKEYLVEDLLGSLHVRKGPNPPPAQTPLLYLKKVTKGFVGTTKDLEAHTKGFVPTTKGLGGQNLW